MYTLLWKRRSPFGTFIGAISGATPPVVGYCAVSDRFDLGAVLLFAILVLWQMPHFFAIGIRRSDEYAAAGIPILPVKASTQTTKLSMLLYIITFAIAAPLLTIFGYTGLAYLVITIFLSLVWLGLAIKGFWITGHENDVRWARKMFFTSLIVLTVIFITITFSNGIILK
jgi:heme o synthase